MNGNQHQSGFSKKVNRYRYRIKQDFVKLEIQNWQERVSNLEERKLIECSDVKKREREEGRESEIE